MANGNTATLPVPMTASVPAQGKPGTELEIGEATAAAATALCRALEQYQNGGLTHEVRMAGGDRIGKVVMLKMAFFDEEKFDLIAHAEGKRVMRRFFDDDFYRRHGPGAGEATMDHFINEVLEVVAHVIKLEKALAAN